MEAADSLDRSTDNQQPVRAWSANEEITSSHPILALATGQPLARKWAETMAKVLSFVLFNVFKGTETSKYFH